MVPAFARWSKWARKVTGAEYANAHMVRERFSNRFQQLFDQIDVLACPSMVASTLPADAMPPDASAFKGPNPLMSFTAPFNMSRNPTLSLPGGDGKGGPPPSLQLVGRLLGEATLFRVGGGLRARHRMASAAAYDLKVSGKNFGSRICSTDQGQVSG